MDDDSADADVEPATEPVTMVVQPIVDVGSGTIVAVEALATLGVDPSADIAAVFAAARVAGQGFALEAACVRAARALRAGLGTPIPIAINVSPDALAAPAVAEALSGDLTGFIVELTEHPASAPAVLGAQVAELRGRGALIAIDDVTTGYSGLLRLAELRPDIIKLDQRLMAGVQGSAERVAVIEALVTVARSLDARVAAEGVEDLADLAPLSALGVDYVQGWAIGRPAPTVVPLAAEVITTCRTARQGLLQPGGGGLAPVGSTIGRVADLYAAFNAIVRSALTGNLELDPALAVVRHACAVSTLVVSALGPGGELVPIGSSGGPSLGPRAGGFRDGLPRYPQVATALRDGTNLALDSGDPDNDPAENELAAVRGAGTTLVLPLVAGTTAVGLLEVTQAARGPWSARAVTHLHGLAELLGTVLAAR